MSKSTAVTIKQHVEEFPGGKIVTLRRCNGWPFMTVWEGDDGRRIVLWVQPGAKMLDVDDAVFSFKSAGK